MVPRALFAFDRENWCLVFASVEDVENGLEANDVDTDEYVVFGDDGTVFEARIAAGFRVRLDETDVRDFAQLQERLERFLRSWSIDCASDDVIDIANAILKADWDDRWPRRPRWLARRMHSDEPPTI